MQKRETIRQTVDDAPFRGATPGDRAPVTLWILRVLLAIVFGMAGLMHSARPIPDLAKALGWPGAVRPGVVRFVGIAELAGAVGLLLPAPALTKWAATGLVAVTATASLFHIWRGEAILVPGNLVLGALAAFVATGHFRRDRIGRRSTTVTPASGRAAEGDIR